MDPSFQVILKCLYVDFCIQWSMYIVSVAIKHERFFDISGSVTFFLLAYLSYEWSGYWTTRQTMQTAMVCIWALRLGLFLYVRIVKEGSDCRFDHIRHSPLRFFVAWTLQGIWIFVTILPTLLVNSEHRAHLVSLPLSLRDYSGWSIWIMGFTIEVIADFQKATFRNDSKNRGKFICTGLWKLSRHPNYFGEILLWFGLYLSASSTLRGYQLLTVLCPMFDYYLITKYSGIPPLEKQGLKRWGTSAEYQTYLKKTPLLVPMVFTNTNI